jgi:hypothetical protein
MRQDRIADAPLPSDLVVAREERRVAAHGVVEVGMSTGRGPRPLADHVHDAPSTGATRRTRVGSSGMTARLTACRGAWGCFVLLAVTVPATAGAATGQVIAARDIGAALAVDGAGRAFMVSPSGRHDPVTRAPVRWRFARPGGVFGPSRILLRAGRAVDAGVAADGSGVIVLQSAQGARRRLRVVTFDAQGRVGKPVAVSPHAERADFAASAVAPSGAAMVVWFAHHGARRWRLEASIRGPGGAAFGRPEPVSAFVRRACCTSVSAAISVRGDAVATWSSTSLSVVWAALRRPGHAFRRPQRLADDASAVPTAVVGANGTAALIYSVQHVPRRTGDGLQVHRSVGAGAFGAAEHANPGGGVTVGAAAITPAGRVLVAWVDRVQGTRAHLSEAGPGEPLAATAELGTDVRPESLAVAGDDDGRAVVAWSELVSTDPASLEQGMAATRGAHDTAFGSAVALGPPWRAAAPELARLVPGGGALVVWKGLRFGGPVKRRAALAVTRLP